VALTARTATEIDAVAAAPPRSHAISTTSPACRG
jgi:hypothetical protein